MNPIAGAEARLTVLLDVRQPQAYLALHPAAQMAEDCGVAVDWLPIAVAPLKAPSQPGPDEDRGTRHRRSRALAIARETATYARAQGLVIEDYYRDPDPTVLNVAWLWVRSLCDGSLLPFLEEAFRAYWARELDPSSTDQVAGLLDSLGPLGSPGIGGTEFSAWRASEGSRAAAELASELAERGMARAPCYLVEDEVFVGRQHLPMIRWILEGRAGRGPI